MEALKLHADPSAARRAPRSLRLVPPTEATSWCPPGTLHGPSRVQVIDRDGTFAYGGDDPFWAQVLGRWTSRHDRQSPQRAHNWVLLSPGSYLAHFDTRRQTIIFEPKGTL